VTIEHLLEILEQAGYGLSLFAVAVIIGSFLISAWRYLRHYRELDLAENFRRFKINLGSGLLLGLEILVLADVIETMTVTPSYSSLAMLASIVVIRTAVSWTLTLEVEGRWPWQSADEEPENA